MTAEPNDMESLLARYHPPGPPAALREALFASVRRRSWFTAIQGIAAALLVAVNLVVIASSLSKAHPAAVTASRDRLAAQISQLQLPLSREETALLAHQFAAADNLTLAPEIHGHLDFSTGAFR